MSLNIESCFSFNGSLIKRESIPSFKALGYSNLGLVDTNSSFFMPFYEECIKNKIKPILALKFVSDIFDYVLFAKNEEGYKELLYFASSRDEGKNTNKEELPISVNLIYVLDIYKATFSDFKKIEESYKYFSDNKCSTYIGVDANYQNKEFLEAINKSLKALIFNKVKYLKEDDREASNILVSIINGVVTNSVANIYQNASSKKAISALYKSYPEILKNTEDFPKEIDLKISYGRHLPKYPLKDKTSKQFLEDLANKGLKRRLENSTKDYETYKKRLDYELDVINTMGFDDYFLVVYDYILYAKKNGILVGPGRGSAASSLVSYSLGIVDIDPLEYSLYFERFLNPSRKTMPDIDTDFEGTKRDDVIKYVEHKYGHYHVSTISTFQTLLAKSAINETAKILKISETKVSEISSLINNENSLSVLLESEEIQKIYQIDEEAKKLFDIAIKIEGLPRSRGTHAAGIIISNEDIRNYSEVHLGINDVLQTTYDADSLKNLGLLKMDFLALRNLSVIHDTLNIVNSKDDNRLILSKIKLDDKETFDLLQKKHTLGIFQLESRGMNDLLSKMKVDNFLDLSLCIALYRPGPMENIDVYISRRFKRESIDYYDDSIKDILEETLGIIVYQEQIMAIVAKYAGFSLAEADILRRAMSDKDSSLILGLKEKFFEGALKLQRNPDVTERLFEDIYKFSGYGFNKSHSISYALVAYYQAYLKAHYTGDFMTVLLKTFSNSVYFKECQSLGFSVLPPDLRYSSNEFRAVDKIIYMPFSNIKGIMGDVAIKIEEIVKEIKPDVTFESFVKSARNKIAKEIIKKLIMAGALDYTGYNKRTMIDTFSGIYDFDYELVEGMTNDKVVKRNEYDFDYLKQEEMNLISFNSKYHPMASYQGKIQKISDLPDLFSEDFETKNISELDVKVVALISSIKEVNVKSTGKKMAILELEDEFMSLRAVVFQNDYERYKDTISKGKIYQIEGNYCLSDRKEKQIIIRRVYEVK